MYHKLERKFKRVSIQKFGLLPELIEQTNRLICVLLLFGDIMRRNKKHTERCSRMGKASQAAQARKRLEAALAYAPEDSYLVFEIHTHNPRTGAKNHLEIRHEFDNGNSRYNVYLNGDKWHKQWSRWGFCRWLFEKIDPVLARTC